MNDVAAGNEKRLVGEALDLLTETLQPYVDEAMSAAYGPNWTEHVAEKTARRRNQKRAFPVSKSDLSVLLSQIQHERIEPWGNRPDSRQIGAYAAEVYFVRNIWAHGGSLEDQYVRLCDTIDRLLVKLDLPTPHELILRTEKQQFSVPRVSFSTDELEGEPSRDPVEEVVAQFGEAVRRPAELFVAWDSGADRSDYPWPLYEGGSIEDQVEYFKATLSTLLRLHAAVEEVERLIHASEAEGLQLPLALACAVKWKMLTGDFNRVHQDAQRYAMEQFTLLEKRRALLEALRELDGDRRNNVLSKLHLELREFIVRGLTGVDDELYATLENAKPVIEKMEELFERVEAAPTELPLKVIEISKQLPEGVALVHELLRAAHLGVLGVLQSEGFDNSEIALKHLRECIAQHRAIGGLSREVSHSSESMLVGLLQWEGMLCNDLGHGDEAIRAFARADEILDRFPLAHPSFWND